MKYAMTSPCDNCPFVRDSPLGNTISRARLAEFAEGEFPCHKTAVLNDDDDEVGQYLAAADSQHCAGALIYLEKRKQPTQMMRIAARLGLYDRRKLNMKANVK